MISRFGPETALLLIDVQVGVDEVAYWSGDGANRNNPQAEHVMLDLLAAWRSAGRQVAFTRHDSREDGSPLKLHLPTGQLKPGFEPADGDLVIDKDVNSGFVGTSLELDLRRRGITRLVNVGFFTNMCVETTTRMAGNLGFDTYLIPDACAAANRVGPDGVDHPAELVHSMAVANLHGEFCTALSPGAAKGLLAADDQSLARAQGNEPA